MHVPGDLLQHSLKWKRLEIIHVHSLLIGSYHFMLYPHNPILCDCEKIVSFIHLHRRHVGYIKRKARYRRVCIICCCLCEKGEGGVRVFVAVAYKPSYLTE